MKGYTLDIGGGLISLKINRPGPGEGQQIMNEFRAAAWILIDQRTTTMVLLTEIVKNIIDHADHGYMLVLRKGGGLHFFANSSQDQGVTPEERKLRRPVDNRSFFLNRLQEFVSGDGAVVDQFFNKDYNYRGRIIEPLPP